MIVADKPRRGYRTLRLPLPKSDYHRFVSDVAFAKETLDRLYQETPELFPTTFDGGYVFNGLTLPSIKQGYRCRRIQLKADGVSFTVAPAFVMPYMTALTEDIEKTLFLRRFNVPYWGLTYVSGRNDMFWYRLEQSFGRLNIVGTTVKQPESLPQDLLADEKHTRRQGDKHYIAMTVAQECILGAEMTGSASEAKLTEAYGVFASEARSVKPDYAPDTVNTDGWAATQNAWRHWFPGVTVIQCFLHAFIKIRDRATKALADSFNEAARRVWEAYEATSKSSFSQRLRRLREWAAEHVPDSAMKKHILDLCAKRDRFTKSYAHDHAHRTSNMVDRLMKFYDRACFDSQYFHGTLASGQQRVRAWAILWNFCPSSPITVKKHGGQLSPAERLNAKRYADNWLENLLISASMNGTSGYQQNPL
jgi:hypothetical protein